jgi:hypothetical protein
MDASADHYGGNSFEVAQYGTTPEEQHIRSPAEPCSLTIMEGSPCPGLLVEKCEETFEISLHSKRAYMKRTNMPDRPVALIVESWPSSSRAFVFFSSSVELAQAWIEKLRMSGCVMSDWQKKCKALKTLSKEVKASATKSEIIHAIMQPREAGMPKNEVIMKVAHADQLDEIFTEAYLWAKFCMGCGHVVGGPNGLYEVVMSGRRTLALIVDTRTAQRLQDTRETLEPRSQREPTKTVLAPIDE